MAFRRGWIVALLAVLTVLSQAAFVSHESVAGATYCNKVVFVADMSVSDGSTFQPGASFNKIWRLKNAGTCTWTTGYSLVFARGDQMGGVASTALPATVKPGETIDLSLKFTAPSTPGHYRGYWQLKAANGSTFGMNSYATDPFWVDINVSSGATIVYDFANNLCAATWRSGAGVIPCPNPSNDARGYAARIEKPRLEDGSLDSGPGILLVPQDKYDGYIQGTYPEITVQAGDRFQGNVGCEIGKSCYVTFRLDYQVDNGPTQIFWKWSEKNEGRFFNIDRDLSALAGKKVKFTLTLLAAGPATGDFAIWGRPLIVRTGGTGPTATWTPTLALACTAPACPAGQVITCGLPGGCPGGCGSVCSTITPTPSGPTTVPVTPSGSYYDFATNACSATWRSGAGILPCPGTDGDARGFVLQLASPQLESGLYDSVPGLLVFPQNKYDGYIQGTYPDMTIQSGDRFQALIGCAYGSSCYVTYRLEYEIGSSGPVILGTWKEKNEGMYFTVNKDLSALAGKTVHLTLTLLATGYASGDRALWAQPRIVHSSSYITPVPTTVTPTFTPTPTVTGTTTGSGLVTGASVLLSFPNEFHCGGPNVIDVAGTITTNGPATVVFHWEMRGDATNTTANETIVFASAGTQTIHEGAYKVDCGNYTARLVITSPNYYSSKTATYTVIEQTITPTVTKVPIPEGYMPIYDFNTFKMVGIMSCSDFVLYDWRQEACNGESGGCWISLTPLFGYSYSGFFRHEGNSYCGLNIP
jgi:hypothetical protein